MNRSIGRLGFGLSLVLCLASQIGSAREPKERRPPLLQTTCGRIYAVLGIAATMGVGSAFLSHLDKNARMHQIAEETIQSQWPYGLPYSANLSGEQKYRSILYLAQEAGAGVEILPNDLSDEAIKRVNDWARGQFPKWTNIPNTIKRKPLSIRQSVLFYIAENDSDPRAQKLARALALAGPTRWDQYPAIASIFGEIPGYVPPAKNEKHYDFTDNIVALQAFLAEGELTEERRLKMLAASRAQALDSSQERTAMTYLELVPGFLERVNGKGLSVDEWITKASAEIKPGDKEFAKKFARVLQNVYRDYSPSEKQLIGKLGKETYPVFMENGNHNLFRYLAGLENHSPESIGPLIPIVLSNPGVQSTALEYLKQHPNLTPYGRDALLKIVMNKDGNQHSAIAVLLKEKSLSLAQVKLFHDQVGAIADIDERRFRAWDFHELVEAATEALTKEEREELTQMKVDFENWKGARKPLSEQPQ
jgi:hypothetical protein